MIQDIYIIGATGNVGSELVKQIFEKGDTDSGLHANPTRVVGLASSTHTLYLPKGISQDQAYNFINRNYDEAQPYRNLGELLHGARYGYRDEETMLVFVDATAINEPMTEFHLQVIRETPYSIVTANKNPVALSDYATFQELTKDSRRYGYRCSVMAGAGAVTFLRDLKDLNDKLHIIEGCLSGTNGYICSELEKGGKLSKIIRIAHSKGYTEPHPRDDLNGLDVARKLVVLARTVGYHTDINSVHVQPFIPQQYLSEDSVDHFLDSISKLDTEFEEKMKSAKDRGQTLRYVAQMDTKKNLNVSLQEVPKASDLGSLKGTLNQIIITSDSYPDGYSIKAPGAGLDVTARNIRRDLLELLPQRKNSI